MLRLGLYTGASRTAMARASLILDFLMPTLDKRIDFTRTTAGTYVDSDGYIKSTPASKNLLTYTQEFDNAAWVKTNAQVVPNVDPATATFGAELGNAALLDKRAATDGTVSRSGGIITFTAATSGLSTGISQEIAVTPGRLYRFRGRMRFVSGTPGSQAIQVRTASGGGGSETGTVFYSGGTSFQTLDLYFVPTSSTVYATFLAIASSTIEVEEAFYSVREVIGGLITAPDGTLTGDALVEDTINSRHSLSQTATIAASATHTVSVYVKAGTGRYFTLSVSRAAAGSVYYAARYDLQTATVTATRTGGGGGTHTASSITAVGNGWYRCVLTGTLSTFTDAVVMASGAINPTGFGDRGAEVYIGTNSTWLLWGAQLEAASAASTYARNFGGLYPPRFDYDPVTLAPRGLLIEEQRTNLLTYSEQFDNAAWSKTNITVTAAATTSPDGTVDAQKLEATATAATSIITPTATVAATAATFSVYVKQGTGATTANIFTLRNVTSATNLIRGTLNYSTGAFTYTAGSTGVTVTNVGNGWWRIVMTATSGITSGDTIRGYVGFDGGPQTAGDHLFAWGAQLEAGTFATSYIPTVASQVTRTADVATVTGANFSNWYNQSAGTFVAEADTFVGVNTVNSYTVVAASDGTSQNRIRGHLYNGLWAPSMTNGGVEQLGGSIGGQYTSGIPAKLAIAIKSNDVGFCVNGSTVIADTVNTVPTVINQLAIANPAIGGVLNGHIRSIRYYPTRLSNAQLQALTAP